MKRRLEELKDKKRHILERIKETETNLPPEIKSRIDSVIENRVKEHLKRVQEINDILLKNLEVKEEEKPVNPESIPEEFKPLYKKLILKFHPDKSLEPSDGTIFLAIQDAVAKKNYIFLVELYIEHFDDDISDRVIDNLYFSVLSEISRLKSTFIWQIVKSQDSLEVLNYLIKTEEKKTKKSSFDIFSRPPTWEILPKLKI